MARQGVFQQSGDIIDYLNSGESVITAGQVVPLTSRIGFAVDDIAPGAIGGVVVKGVFNNVPADNSVAFNVGDPLYWDATAGEVTKTSTNNTPAGWSVAAKAQADTIVVVQIEDPLPVGTVTQQPAQDDSTAATIADLKTDFNALLAKLRSAGIIG
ncbi:MAG TPA: DUF2190 family protein [Methylomusa anaerophila]|uniref:Head fiber protein n=1 Tax=Methylomusa anaerophila TaxID=1930071 RepID=A0A348AJ01_9FIRM|nr:DUF2190 family protein [Methylomusa anaerophila]BBB91049.1 hypothetical protein MAMMFC1_01717 [Methylomusa anaerophila]HML88923.1 DUF2190 family protein [Methylomusa anaerophila]